MEMSLIKLFSKFVVLQNFFASQEQHAQVLKAKEEELKRVQEAEKENDRKLKDQIEKMNAEKVRKNKVLLLHLPPKQSSLQLSRKKAFVR